MKLFYALITFVVITTSSFGQNLTKTTTLDAIKKLSFLVGNWQGSGWFKSTEGTDSLKINQTTTVIDSGTTIQMDILSEISPANSFKTLYFFLMTKEIIICSHRLQHSETHPMVKR